MCYTRFYLSIGGTVVKYNIGLILYFIFAMSTGFVINQLSVIHSDFSQIETFVWLSSFLILTFFFKSTREIITPLIDFKVLKKPSSYFYIIMTLILSYTLQTVCLHYEILLDENLVNSYKYSLLIGEDIVGVIDSTLFTPIWEEIFFRGVLLFLFLKFLKPSMAIMLSSAIFSLFHPMYWIITFLSGILLGVTTYKTRSLIPSIITHSIWNLYTSKLFLYF